MLIRRSAAAGRHDVARDLLQGLRHCLVPLVQRLDCLRDVLLGVNPDRVVIVADRPRTRRLHRLVRGVERRDDLRLEVTLDLLNHRRHFTRVRGDGTWCCHLGRSPSMVCGLRAPVRWPPALVSWQILAPQTYLITARW